MQKTVNSRNHGLVLFDPIRIQSGVTTPGQSRSGSDGNGGVFRILQNPALLEPHHQII